MLYVVDGGMVGLPVVARVEGWEPGDRIAVSHGADGLPLMCVAYNRYYERLCELGIEVPE